MVVTAIILILLLILLAILVVPFQIDLNLYKEGSKVRGNFRISWMKIRFLQRKIPSKKKEKEKKKKDKKEKFDVERFLKIISNFGDALPYFERIFTALWKSITIEKFSLKFIIGFYSPAETAMVSGYLWSLASVANIIPNTRLTVEPDFQEERLDLSTTLKLKLRLFWIVIEFIRAFTKKPVRSFISELRRMRG